MNDIYNIIIVIAAFVTVLLINYVLYKYIVYKALKRHIKPQLLMKDLSFESMKWLGLLNKGGFQHEGLTLVPVLKFGNPVIASYFDVFYFDGLSKKKVTVKIESFFTAIVKVSYSHEL